MFIASVAAAAAPGVNEVENKNGLPLTFNQSISF